MIFHSYLRWSIYRYLKNSISARLTVALCRHKLSALFTVLRTGIGDARKAHGHGHLHEGGSLSTQASGAFQTGGNLRSAGGGQLKQDSSAWRPAAGRFYLKLGVKLSGTAALVRRRGSKWMGVRAGGVLGLQSTTDLQQPGRKLVYQQGGNDVTFMSITAQNGEMEIISLLVVSFSAHFPLQHNWSTSINCGPW